MAEVTPAEWVAELESGRWRKARRQLIRTGSGNRYCCLGVLGRLSGTISEGTDTEVSGWLHNFGLPPWMTLDQERKIALANDSEAGYPVALIREMFGVDDG